MDYQEFVKRIGKLHMPKDVSNPTFLGTDSIHYINTLGTVKDNGCTVTLPADRMEFFIELIGILEARGAVREVDYVVCCTADKETYMVGVHTTTKFMSDEDFDDSVGRIGGS